MFLAEPHAPDAKSFVFSHACIILPVKAPALQRFPSLSLFAKGPNKN